MFEVTLLFYSQALHVHATKRFINRKFQFKRYIESRLHYQILYNLGAFSAYFPCSLRKSVFNFFAQVQIIWILKR